MTYTAIVSAHIFVSEGGFRENDIEIFNRIDNDVDHTGIFDDIDYALLDQVEPRLDENGSYFFMAKVQSRFVTETNWEGTEYGVEHEVAVIEKLEDLSI